MDLGGNTIPWARGSVTLLLSEYFTIATGKETKILP